MNSAPYRDTCLMTRVTKQRGKYELMPKCATLYT